MATNNLLTIASAAGASVATDATWAPNAARTLGFQVGIVDPLLFNKALRQGAFGTSTLGQLVTNYALVDANDDGNVPGFLTNLRIGIAAMLSGTLFGLDTSATANAIVVAIDPAPPTLTNYRELYVRVANTVTGPTTLALNALGSKPVTRQDGTAIQAGDIVAGQLNHFLFDAQTGQWVLATFGKSEVPKVAINQTLYVRTDATGANPDGSANTAAAAFPTIFAAADYGRRHFFLGGGTLTLQLGNTGTYASPGNLPALGGTIAIVGDTTNQSGYTITGTGQTLIGAVLGANVSVSGVTTQCAGSNTSALGANTGGVINASYVTFSSSVATTGGHAYASGGGNINVGTGCICTGSAAAMYLASSGIVTLAAPLTINLNPTFSIATAYATSNGSVLVGNSSTVSGTATGPRYNATVNGVINTFGGGVNFFPGSAVGTVATGGQYV